MNSAHERMLARRLRAAGHAVSVSHEILPEIREFERTATTAANAYLAPVMASYLRNLQSFATRAPGQRASKQSRSTRLDSVRVMQSNGGVCSASMAAREPVRTILSGPAGGVLGAQYVAALAGLSRIISFDMGGTSTDVALIETAGGTTTSSGVRTTTESVVAGLPVAVAMLDIHTVGAGGGSIARFDRAGALRVGPESAGADPGPIAYGRGEKAHRHRRALDSRPPWVRTRCLAENSHWMRAARGTGWSVPAGEWHRWKLSRREFSMLPIPPWRNRSG